MQGKRRRARKKELYAQKEMGDLMTSRRLESYAPRKDEGYLSRIALRFAAWAERWFPEFYVFAALGVGVISIAALLKREGYLVNHKKLFRLYRKRGSQYAAVAAANGQLGPGPR